MLIKQYTVLALVALSALVGLDVSAQVVPVELVAIQGTGSGATLDVHLAWIPAAATPLVRVVRNSSRVPATSTDGSTVYQGSAKVFKDTNLASGQYYYAAFGVQGSSYSAARSAGASGVVVSAANLPNFFDSGSARGISCLSVTDSDKDGSLALAAGASQLTTNLRGFASNGELDRMDLCLDRPLTGRFALELDVKTPSLMTDNWNLVIYPYGRGGVWSAIYRNSWRSNSGGWASLKTGLQPNRTYRFSLVVDGASGSVSFYVDGQKVSDRAHGFTEASRLRIANYGYGNNDLTYQISRVKWLDVWPSYHQPPPLRRPSSVVAVGASGGARVAWSDALNPVRLLRKSAGYSTNATDGTVVYEGRRTSATDTVAPGTYYYTAFEIDGSGNASAGAHAGSHGTRVVNPQGTPLLASSSARTFSCVTGRDVDGDGTFVVDEQPDGSLKMDLAGSATNGEQDRIDLCLNSELTNVFTLEMELTTPARMDQSWNLIAYPSGRGGAWMAFNQDKWYLNYRGWKVVHSGLVPNKSYKLALVVDGATGLASFYVDEQQVAAHRISFSRMSRLRFSNYGYGSEDQSWQAKNIRYYDSAVAYHQAPPLQPPRSGVALGKVGGAAMSWSASLYPVRVLRKSGGYSANATDGTVVYEGSANSTSDSVAPGTYYYTLYSLSGTNISTAVRIGTHGTRVVAPLGTPLLAVGSDQTFSCAAATDVDRDETFRVDEETDGSLSLELKGSAKNGEQDRVDLCLANPLSGQFGIEMDVRTPARMDQSWNLIVYPYGSGGAWTAFNGNRWLQYQSGWRQITSGLNPNTTYRLSMIVDGTTGLTSYYLNQQKVGDQRLRFSRMTRLRIANYGYGRADQTYRIANVRTLDSWPSYHQPATLAPPLSAFATGGKEGALISWRPGLFPVRVVRKSGSYSTGPTDGTKVYEGMASSYVDRVSSGRYYYTLYGVSGTQTSPAREIGTQGTLVDANGRSRFMHASSARVFKASRIQDRDGDETLTIAEDATGMSLQFLGRATVGEHDYVDLQLDRSMSGTFTIELDVKTPSRMDQSWNFVIYPYGQGGLWTAFHSNSWRVSSGGWVTLGSPLQPSTTYKLAMVVNGATGFTTYYVDGRQLTTRPSSLRRLDRLRLSHHGYSSADVSYHVSGLKFLQGAPSYHVAPSIKSPASVFAASRAGGVALGWVKGVHPVRIVRHGTLYASATAGTVVYEGTATSYTDSVGPGRYYYTAYSTDGGGAFSSAVNFGTQGTRQNASGLADFMGAGSERKISRVTMRDRNSSGTLQVDERDQALRLDLKGSARNGEGDSVEFELDQALSGRFTVNMKLTTPSRVDQSWNLIIYPYGRGGAWTAIYRNTWRVSRGGWHTMSHRFAPNTTYDLSIVVDGASGVATYYVDGARMLDQNMGLTELRRIRFGNYGYAGADLTYKIDDLRVSASWPSFHTPPALNRPALVAALGRVGGAALAWDIGNYPVRIVRKTGGYPTGPVDGTTIYEGRSATFRDTVAPGRYYYSFFATNGSTFSTAHNAGQVGTVVMAGRGSPLFGAGSARSLKALRVSDRDHDGTLTLNEQGSELQVGLAGAATDGEQDYVEFEFSQATSGRFAIEFDVTTPSRVDQNWNLLLYPYGRGGAWTAIYRDGWRSNLGGWHTLESGLQRNTKYRFGFVVDGNSGVVSFYVDGQKLFDERTGLRELRRLRVGNYGYASRDLDYRIGDLKVLTAWPSYHTPPQPRAVSAFAALGGKKGALLSWVRGLYPVRIVRKSGAYPANANDGATVYEGVSTSFVDPVGAGTHYYSAFSTDGSVFSPGASGGTEGTTVDGGDGSVFVDSGSSRKVSCSRLYDRDRDGTFSIAELDGKLTMRLDGSARNGEQDRIQLCLDSPLTGDFSMELDLTMGARIDQSWNLILYPYGSGGAWMAIRHDGWWISSGGWYRIAGSLAAGRTYKLTMVVESALGVATFYVDGHQVGRRSVRFRSFSRLRLGNYGYAAADLNYGIDNMKFTAGVPSYHTPASLQAPAAAIAVNGQGKALLTWARPVYDVRIIRKTGGYPSGPQDGSVVYEGRSTYYEQSVSAGQYFYKAYARSGSAFSSGTNLGTQGVGVTSSGLSGLIASDSAMPLSCARLADADSDGSFNAAMEAGGLRVHLDGDADNGENDHLNLCLSRPLTGQYALEFDVTTPPTMTEDWNLVIYPHGSGGVWTAIYRNSWRVSTGGGWQTLTSNLAPDTKYTFAIVQDGSGGVSSFYIDGRKLADVNTGMRQTSRLRFGNYGYASGDLSYLIGNIRVLTQPPSYHQSPALQPANALLAVGGAGSVSLAWPAPVRITRVVRKSGSYSTGPQDGTVVYEGVNSTTDDMVGAGTYYYSLYETDGSSFSAPVHAGSAGTVVRSSGLAPIFETTSLRGASCAGVRDQDRDGSIRMSESGDGFVVDLLGAASNGEFDYNDLCLGAELRGDFGIEMDIRTPAALTQSWNFVIQPRGAGAALTAFYRDTLRLSGPGGWVTVKSGLVPNTTYRVAWLVRSGVVSIYIDGQKMIDRALGFDIMSRVRFANYGFGQADQRYRVAKIKVLDSLPSYYQVPQLRSPAAIVAVGSKNAAAIGWVEGLYPTRIVRKVGSAPTGPADGTTVFEGRGNSFSDVVPDGTYHYSAFQVNGNQASPGRSTGSSGVVVQSSGFARAVATDSHSGFSCVRMRDVDEDGGIQAREAGTEIVLDLAGASSNGEQDYVEFCLGKALQGDFAVELDVTTPARLDQSWGLFINPRGKGGLWTAIYRNSWRRSRNGWRQVFGGMQPNTTYRLAMVVDGSRKVVTWYVDGRAWFEEPVAFTEMSHLRVGNYGYGSADQTYRLSGIKVLNRLPTYHTRPGIAGTLTVQTQPERAEYTFSSRSMDWMVQLSRRASGVCGEVLYEHRYQAKQTVSGSFAALSPGAEYCWRAVGTFNGRDTIRQGIVKLVDLPVFTAQPRAGVASAPNRTAIDVNAATSAAGSGQVLYASGKCGQGVTALSFDGADVVSIPGALVAGQSNFTWLAWVYTSAANQSSTLWASDGGAMKVGLRGGRPYVALRTTRGVATAAASVALPLNQWVLLGVERGTSLHLKMPLLGQLVSVARVRVSGALAPTGRGAQLGASRGGFVGRVAAVAVVGAALTSNATRALMGAGPNGELPVQGAIATWDFAEGSLVQSVYDTTGHHHSGVLGTDEATTAADPSRSMPFTGAQAMGNNRNRFAARLSNLSAGPQYCYVVQVSTPRGTIVSQLGGFERIVDQTPPQISRPKPIVTVNCAGASAAAVPRSALGVVTVRDNLDQNPSLQARLGSATGALAQFPLTVGVGRTNIYWVATDFAGNRSAVRQELRVSDAVAPVASGGAALLVEATSPSGTPVNVVPSSYADVCMAPALPTISHNGPSRFGLGDTAVTMTVRDASNNATSVTRTVRVVDTTAPAFSPAPQAIRIAHDGTSCFAFVLPKPDVIDAGYPANRLTVTSSSQPTCWALGQHTVSWTVTDPAGNTRNVSQAVDIVSGAFSVAIRRLEVGGQPVSGGAYYSGPVTLVVDVSNGTAPYSLTMLPSGATVTSVSATRFNVTYASEGAFAGVVVQAEDANQDVGGVVAPAFGIDLTPPTVQAGLFSQLNVQLADPATFPYFFRGEQAAMETIMATDAASAPVSLAGYGLFDGVDDFATIPASPGLNLSSAMTIAAWVWPEGPADAVVVEQLDGAGQPVVHLGTAASGRVRAELRIDGVAVRVNGPTLSPHRWHHVALAYDGRVVRLFVDGKPAAQRWASGQLSAGSAPLTVGARWASPTALLPFAGRIAEPSMRSTAWSEPQVRRLYLGGFAAREVPDAQSIFVLDLSGAGQTIVDRSAAGHNAWRGRGVGVSTDDPASVTLAQPTAPGSSGLAAFEVRVERVDGTRVQVLANFSQSPSGSPLAVGARVSGGLACGGATNGACLTNSIDIEAARLMTWDFGAESNYRLVAVARDAAGNQTRVDEYFRTRTYPTHVAEMVAEVGVLASSPVHFSALVELRGAHGALQVAQRYLAINYIEGAHARVDRAASLLWDAELLGIPTRSGAQRLIRALVGEVHWSLAGYSTGLPVDDEPIMQDALRYLADARFGLYSGQAPTAAALARTAWVRAHVLSPDYADMRAARRSLRARWVAELAAFGQGQRTISALRQDSARINMIRTLATETRDLLRSVTYAEVTGVLGDSATLNRPALLEMQDVLDRNSNNPNELGDLVAVTNSAITGACLDRLTTLQLADDEFTRCYLRLNDLASIMLEVQSSLTPTGRWRAVIAEALGNMLEITLLASPTGVPWLGAGVAAPAEVLMLPDSQAGSIPGAIAASTADPSGILTRAYASYSRARSKLDVGDVDGALAEFATSRCLIVRVYNDLYSTLNPLQTHAEPPEAPLPACMAVVSGSQTGRSGPGNSLPLIKQSGASYTLFGTAPGASPSAELYANLDLYGIIVFPDYQGNDARIRAQITLSANRAALEAWVRAGGVLYLGIYDDRGNTEDMFAPAGFAVSGADDRTDASVVTDRTLLHQPNAIAIAYASVDSWERVTAFPTGATETAVILQATAASPLVDFRLQAGYVLVSGIPIRSQYPGWPGLDEVSGLGDEYYTNLFQYLQLRAAAP